MTSWAEGHRPITIAILAMGGEGGGVLADLIVHLGERHGFSAQNTSVAGVAQRTGATVYYIELFPPPSEAVRAGGRSEPILSVFPTPGEVDVVIASELMEAGRAIQRGFSTPDRTVLIASTNRVYSIHERIAPGDGRVDSDELLAAAHRGAKRFIGADFNRLAEECRSVVTASLFGALAASGTLPFEREAFEQAIRDMGKGVEPSLAAFAAGFDAALLPAPEPTTADEPTRERTAVPVTMGPRRPPSPEAEARRAAEVARDELAVTDPQRLVGPALGGQAQRVGADFPAAARSMLLRGCERTAVYQDPTYTDRYLDRVARVAAVDPDRDGAARLTTEAARNAALWMCYQDTIHVAHQKIRQERLDRVRQEARAGSDQLIQVHEYLHPQAEELTDTMPRWMGRPLAASETFRRWVDRLTRKGMVVNTTSVLGFSMLRVMAAMRPLRPKSLRFGREQQGIDRWLGLVVDVASTDSDLATEIVMCQGVRKGYGATHAHGVESFTILMEQAEALRGDPMAAERLADLRKAATADEDGTTLRNSLSGTRVAS